jgi:hypothetical protein
MLCIIESLWSNRFEHVDYISNNRDMHRWGAATELTKLQGGIVSIDDTDLSMPMDDMKMKAYSLHWEFMFAKARHYEPKY